MIHIPVGGASIIMPAASKPMQIKAVPQGDGTYRGSVQNQDGLIIDLTIGGRSTPVAKANAADVLIVDLDIAGRATAPTKSALTDALILELDING